MVAQTRRVTFRLYPNKTQLAKLFEFRRLHCYLYNAALYERKVSYQKLSKSINYLEQQNCLPEFKKCWPEYKQLGSQTLQATVKRVDFAYARFFQGLGKYPRFKSIRKYSGWTYPGFSGWKLNSNGKHGTIELKGIGGKIRIRGEAKHWGKLTTCTIVYRPSQDKWYASITLKCDSISRTTGPGAIGIDLGVQKALTITDGNEVTIIANPRLLQLAKEQISQAEKGKRRKRPPKRKQKIKASKRWKKAQKRVSKLKRLVANRRANWVHQVSTEIVSCNSLVATEKLKIKNMTRKAKSGKRKKQKTGLNRNILDVGMGMLLSAIKYKIDEAGGIFLEAPTIQLKPSQRCSKCGYVKKKILSERVHKCSKCNYETDRDVNAAEVILSWALGTSVLKRGANPSTEKPKVVKDCGGFQQGLAMKRQKPRVQRSNPR